MTRNRTILVIDDSSTIRRLVDNTLSRDGYSVILAPNAEDGLDFAVDNQPDMILLDHQLPGTTGLEVCKQLTSDSSLSSIPVVISSTLRKKAYVEYADMDNVVDMLPKPYTEELLLTTVANALDTGSLVVESQSQGTAVPEVINAQGESDLAGTFGSFRIREVLDFLNNSRKDGRLEVEAVQKRYSIFLENGHVVGITATGVPADEVVDRLPKSLEELAPVLSVTMGRGGTALESIVDLLNSEVLDPRLLRRLLRHQAAVLLVNCFGEKLKSFRFDSSKSAPSLFQRLPLDISVLALLVEGASTRSASEVPAVADTAKFTRQPIRGQNLDRAGLTAQQSLVLGQLTSAKTLIELVNAVGGEIADVRNVLYGLELAELVCCQDEDAESALEVVVYEANAKIANKISKAFAKSDSYKVTVVNDAMAARLLARRVAPSVVVVDASDEEAFLGLRTAVTSDSTKWIATGSEERPDADLTIPRPYDAVTLLDALDCVIDSAGTKVNSIMSTLEVTKEQDLCTT